jgi:hypothetical protein
MTTSSSLALTLFCPLVGSSNSLASASKASSASLASVASTTLWQIGLVGLVGLSGFGLISLVGISLAGLISHISLTRLIGDIGFISLFGYVGLIGCIGHNSLASITGLSLFHWSFKLKTHGVAIKSSSATKIINAAIWYYCAAYYWVMREGLLWHVPRLDSNPSYHDDALQYAKQYVLPTEQELIPEY